VLKDTKSVRAHIFQMYNAAYEPPIRVRGPYDKAARQDEGAKKVKLRR